MTITLKGRSVDNEAPHLTTVTRKKHTKVRGSFQRITTPKRNTKADIGNINIAVIHMTQAVKRKVNMSSDAREMRVGRMVQRGLDHVNTVLKADLVNIDHRVLRGIDEDRAKVRESC